MNEPHKFKDCTTAWIETLRRPRAMLHLDFAALLIQIADDQRAQFRGPQARVRSQDDGAILVSGRRTSQSGTIVRASTNVAALNSVSISSLL
jgi:hypothetical protein